jgi:hypothetical protein
MAQPVTKAMNVFPLSFVNMISPDDPVRTDIMVRRQFLSRAVDANLTSRF